MNTQDIDLFNRQSNTQINNTLSTTGAQSWSGSTHATLYLLKQRRIPDQMRRSHLYQFGGQFRDDLMNNLNDAMTTNHRYTAKDAMMPDVISAREAVLPSATGDMVNLKLFSDYWTFVLILDQGNSTDPLGIASSIPSRMLYSGWVISEPATKSGARWVFNPSAVFQTTHHTTMVIQQQMTPFGVNRQITTTGDFDYLDAQTAQALTQSPGTVNLYSLQPNHVAGAIVMDSVTGSVSTAGKPLASLLQQGKGSVEIPSDLNSPTYHLKTIVGGLVDTIKHTTGNDTDIFDTGADAFMSTLSHACGCGANFSTTSKLDPSKPFTMGDLTFKFGDGLVVNVVDQPYDTMIELANPGSPTKRNVMTAVLSSSLPPLLAEFGLADVSFRYNSWVKSDSLDTLVGVNDKGLFQLFNISSLYQITQDRLNNSWNLLQKYLRNTVFPIILANAGEFDLMVHCSIAGTSLINLNLKDELPESGLVETNNLLGGLNSPLIGAQSVAQTNACELANVVRQIAGPETSGMGMFDMGATATAPMGLF